MSFIKFTVSFLCHFHGSDYWSSSRKCFLILTVCLQYVMFNDLRFTEMEILSIFYAITIALFDSEYTYK